MSVSYSTPVIKKRSLVDVEDINELEKIINDGNRVVVDLTAKWCYPCRLIAPRYKEISEKYGTKLDIHFFKLDEKVNDFYLDVKGFPTFFFFEDGRELHRILGADIDGVEKKVIEFWG